MNMTKPKKKSNSTQKELNSVDSLPLFATESPTPLVEEGIEEEKEKMKQATHEGRAAGLRYYERKRIVLAREKHNQNELIFIKAPTTTWYKAFDKSATYFAAKYAKLIGSKATIKIDRDYQFQSKIGVVSIPNMEAMIEKLKKVNIELIDTKDEIYTFKLNERITIDEYNLMREQSEAVLERANKMIKPKEMMPNLLEDAKDVFQTVFWTFRDMHEWARQRVGAEFADELRGIIVDYTVLVKSKELEAEEFLDRAMERVCRADGCFVALLPLRIVNDDKMLEIATKLLKLRNQIIFERKKLAVKKIDAENHGRVS